MKFLTSLVVGIPITYLVIAIAANGFNNANAILFMSIVCTAGISLAIWIPLMVSVGFATIAVTQFLVRGAVMLLMNTPLGNSAEIVDSDRTPSLPNTAIVEQVGQQIQRSSQTVLKHYIERAVNLGHDYNRILSALTEHGWSEEDVRQAYETVTHPG
jgi:hypothetical protein